MPPYFFITMNKEVEAIATLAAGLQRLATERQLVLADQEKEIMLARVDRIGSLYETLQTIRHREISYAEMIHSFTPIPGVGHDLEFTRFQFNRKSDAEIASAGEVMIPAHLKRAILAELRTLSPRPSAEEGKAFLRLLWLNNEDYVRNSPPRRVARLLWLYHQARTHAGIYLDVEPMEIAAPTERQESRLVFAVEHPPERDYLSQVMEVFRRLRLGVRRAYTLSLSTGTHPYFLATFYIWSYDGHPLEKDSALFRRLRRELYNTQILAVESPTYAAFIGTQLMTGEEASLVNALIGFCHTNLAHNQPHRYTLEDVMRAFHSHPDVALKLTKLFELRFDPEVEDREAKYEAALAATSQDIRAYNTGHKQLDEFRRSVFRAALAFIRRTLKTNFFVAEKHALSFRLDPAYLEDLGPDFTADLPPERPFRITYFHGRHGLGYHIGFSDIARGGWRTILTKTRDDYVTVANSVFRETYVLAHTQHLKNKDIYEGGSKLVVVVNAPDARTKEQMTQTLHKVQYGFINAFLDIFITENGSAKDPRVVDYYREDEPIELGPDENMHDEMIEVIAKLSRQRGYVLGIGIISSKQVGINHKAYGVTSTGVVKFAEIAMRELGIDIRRDPFAVKFTGGPNGDVAGNSMRILLARCPKIQIRLILDGTGALVDPAGADSKELSRILLQQDVEVFDPMKLSPGGFLLYRNVSRVEGLRTLFRRVVRTGIGLEEHWVTTDEFHRELDGLLFAVPADLFIPAGGRPETVDGRNWEQFFGADGSPSARAIVEGANSFLTPEARTRLQERGVMILRDASANKCGVISSSYEIIANLLLTETEFLAHKEAYVADVLHILEGRAGDEATLIFRRRRESGGKLAYTDISDAISVEINRHYADLFEFFRSHPALCLSPPFRTALYAHLPKLLRESPTYRQRVKRLPEKYLFAMLACEIALTMVYQGGFERDFDADLRRYIARTFA
jgi:glutamate dehydrogenase